MSGLARPAAVASAVIAAALVIGVTVALLTSNTGPANSAQGGAATTAYLRFQPGECLLGADLPAALLNRGPAPWDATASQVSCGKSHDAEVYFANSGFWSQSLAFPGESLVYGAARTECRAALTQYVGISSNASQYSISLVLPSPASWSTGDRSLQCVAFLGTRTGVQPITGSIKDSRR